MSLFSVSFLLLSLATIDHFYGDIPITDITQDMHSMAAMCGNALELYTWPILIGEVAS